MKKREFSKWYCQDEATTELGKKRFCSTAIIRFQKCLIFQVQNVFKGNVLFLFH